MIQKNNKGYKTAIRYIKPGIRSNEIRKGLILCNRSFGETLILDAIINDYRPVISRTVIKLGKFVASSYFEFILFFPSRSKMTRFEMKEQRIITFE